MLASPALEAEKRQSGCHVCIESSMARDGVAAVGAMLAIARVEDGGLSVYSDPAKSVIKRGHKAVFTVLITDATRRALASNAPTTAPVASANPGLSGCPLSAPGRRRG